MRGLRGELVHEQFRLPGFDPDKAVPAVALHPASGGPFPEARHSRHWAEVRLSRPR